jgi:hypothetical protein
VQIRLQSQLSEQREACGCLRWQHAGCASPFSNLTSSLESKFNNIGLILILWNCASSRRVCRRSKVHVAVARPVGAIAPGWKSCRCRLAPHSEVFCIWRHAAVSVCVHLLGCVWAYGIGRSGHVSLAGHLRWFRQATLLQRSAP